MKKRYQVLVALLICIFANLLISLPALSQTLQWAKSMGGTSSDAGYSIAIDGTGNVYTVGQFQDTADFDPGAGVFNLFSAGDFDVFISKLDPSGSFLWAKGVGGASWDKGYSIAIDGSGNVYTVGHFQDTTDFDPGAGIFNIISKGMYDIFISKLDSSGNFLWAKTIGGTGYDTGYSIALDGVGNVYTVGHFQDTVDFDPGAGVFNLSSSGNGIFISKLDSSGTFLWAKAMGDTGHNVGYSIVLDGIGNVYSTGHFRDTVDFDPGVGVFNLISAGNYDIFVSKLDSSGNFLWAKAMGGPVSDIGSSIAVDGSGNVYTTGWFNFTSDFDPGVGMFSLTPKGGNDIFISKLDSSGNFLWAKAMGGIGEDGGSSIALDAAGNVYTTGSFSDIGDFDPGSGIYNLTSIGETEIFISKLNPSGNFLSANVMRGPSYDFGSSIILDGSGNVYAAGSFMFTADFDPSGGVFNLFSNGNSDIFIVKLGITAGVCENAFENHISVYPNPFSSITTIYANQNFAKVLLTVYNCFGQIVKQIDNIDGQTIIFHRDNLPSGLYFVCISKENKIMAANKMLIVDN